MQETLPSSRGCWKKSVFEFLARLNSELNEARGRILGRKPLQSVQEVFACIKREESGRNVMMNGQQTGQNVENSALLTATLETALVANQKNSRKEGEKIKVWHDYYNKTRHTRETCWKIHGKPAKNNHFLERNNHAFQAKNSQSSNLRGAETQPFTKEQLELLHRFINQSQNNPTPNPFSSLAQKGNFLFALSVSSKAKAP